MSHLVMHQMRLSVVDVALGTFPKITLKGAKNSLFVG